MRVWESNLNMIDTVSPSNCVASSSSSHYASSSSAGVGVDVGWRMRMQCSVGRSTPAE